MPPSNFPSFPLNQISILIQRVDLALLFASTGTKDRLEKIIIVDLRTNPFNKKIDLPKLRGCIKLPNETTEKILESYYRYLKGCFTLPNVKCEHQKELDLLAIQCSTKGDILNRFHIECSISISGNFSKLTADKFSDELYKNRSNQATLRRTLGYFIKKKFAPQEVTSKLTEYGFLEGNYRKVIATMGWTLEAKEGADDEGIELLDIGAVCNEIDSFCEENGAYFTDDTLRTIQLFIRTNTIKCPYCRQKIKRSAIYCEHCGRSLN